ncbi:MAG: prolipoprotein diacylglyceryl transferase [Planctomycetales bacterium]|nr:prolipoprotein diacylglyceryl transferase [Planctomycetales bacterium]
MRQTLFEIPYEAFGIPLFGFGILFWVWIAGVAFWFVRQKRRGAATGELLNQLPMMVLIAAAILFLPRAFPGALPIRGYGVFLLLAVVSAVALAAHRARCSGIDPEVILSLAVWLFVAGIVGARAFHVIQYWKTDYLRPTAAETIAQIVNIPQGGLVVYGSLLGGALAFFAFTRRHHLPALQLADLIAPSVMLGIALGRVGCLMNGCCFGGLCDLPWSVTFPAGSPPFHSQVQRGLLPSVLLYGGAGAPVSVLYVSPQSAAAAAGLRDGAVLREINGAQPRSAAEAYQLIFAAEDEGRPAHVLLDSGKQLDLPGGSIARRSLPVHPTQIYSAVNALLLCAVLLAFHPFRRHDGVTFALMATLYPISRFLIEVIRTDELAVGKTNMSISQNVSVLVIVAVAAFWVFLFTRAKRTAAASAA